MWDAALVDIRRFNSRGEFQNIVARRGNGPGDLFRPAIVGLDAGQIYSAENRTGKLTWLTPEGRLVKTLDLDLRKYLPDGGGLAVIDLTVDQKFVVMTIEPDSASGEAARPYDTRRYIIVDAELGTATTGYSLRAQGRSIRLHNGKLLVGYAGPDDSPIVSRDERSGRFLRIDRPIPAAGHSAEVRIQRLTEYGTLLYGRTLTFKPRTISAAFRDSVRQVMQRSATAGGRLPLDAATMRALDELGRLSDYFPAVQTSANGPNGSLWLKQWGPSTDGMADWIVLDSLFTPVARARVPALAENFGFPGQQPWATMTDADGIPIVVRFRVR